MSLTTSLSLEETWHTNNEPGDSQNKKLLHETFFIVQGKDPQYEIDVAHLWS